MLRVRVMYPIVVESSTTSQKGLQVVCKLRCSVNTRKQVD